jgi:copper(I)-binding protein
MKLALRTAAFAAAIFLSSSAFAQVTAKDPWVRGTVGKLAATGAFMQLTAASDARLVAAASPVAGVVEIHEMRMEGDVMRMRAITALDLPAGKTVELRPGGYHVMLMDLKRPLQDGETVPITLTVEAKDGTRSTLQLEAPVRGVAGQGGGHGHMKKH